MGWSRTNNAGIMAHRSENVYIPDYSRIEQLQLHYERKVLHLKTYLLLSIITLNDLAEGFSKPYLTKHRAVPKVFRTSYS